MKPWCTQARIDIATLAPEVGFVAFVYAALSPLLQPDALALPMSDWSTTSFVLALIVVAALSALVAKFSVRFVLPRLTAFSSWQTWNRLAERAFRLFFWMMPAFGIGFIVAIGLCGVGVYGEQPYRILSVNALSTLAAGVTGILAMTSAGQD